VSRIPDEVRRLAEERARRRAAREFAAADRLRERIAEAGFSVVDRPDGGYDVAPAAPEEPRRLDAAEVPSVLDRPPNADWSVHWLHEGWAQDVLRGMTSFGAAAGGRAVHQVVVESVAGDVTWPEDVEVIRLSGDPGFGAARNAGLRRSRGRLVAVVDGSVEAEGDAFGPLEEALMDPAVGVAGPVGVVTDDLREFRKSPGPEVDAVEGYLMAFRREVLSGGVAFDPKFRFYRAADIDLSFQIKAMGFQAMRVDVPIRRHEHRRWARVPADRRDALSKRNMYRFLDRFRGRTDLLVGPGNAEP
jgi:glycosyltransferase involved in cell wall biosynthesis